jgi:hypothetical protein
MLMQKITEKPVVISRDAMKFLVKFYSREFDSIIPDEPEDGEKIFSVKQAQTSKGLLDLIDSGIVTNPIDVQNTKNENFKVFALTDLGQSLLATGFQALKEEPLNATTRTRMG